MQLWTVQSNGHKPMTTHQTSVDKPCLYSIQVSTNYLKIRPSNNVWTIHIVRNIAQSRSCRTSREKRMNTSNISFLFFFFRRSRQSWNLDTLSHTDLQYERLWQHCNNNNQLVVGKKNNVAPQLPYVAQYTTRLGVCLQNEIIVYLTLCNHNSVSSHHVIITMFRPTKSLCCTHTHSPTNICKYTNIGTHKQKKYTYLALEKHYTINLHRKVHLH